MIAVRRSVHWLLALMDSESGRTPNLGANDGAYIFPLTVLPFDDYRPVVHAAARLFLDYDLPHGAWDEMALWFGAQAAAAEACPCRVTWAINSMAKIRGRTCGRPNSARVLPMPTSCTWTCGGAA